MENNQQKEQKKVLFWTRITGICSALIFICMAVLTLSFVSYQPRINGILGNLEEMTAELEQTGQELTKTLRSLNDQGLNEVYKTLENVQKIDIDRLNESIDSLYQVINPLANLFR